MPVVVQLAARSVLPRERKAARRAQAPRRPVPRQSGGGVPVWAVVLGILLLVKLLAAVGGGAFSSGKTPQPVRTSYDYQERMREQLRQVDEQHERELRRTIDVPPASWTREAWLQLSVEARIAMRRLEARSVHPSPRLPTIGLQPVAPQFGEQHRLWLETSDGGAPPPGWSAGDWQRLSSAKKKEFRDILRHRLHAAAPSDGGNPSATP